jgi:hypothetical protein
VVKATGNITTIAGNGTAGSSGDGGLATAAELNGPVGVAVDTAGDLFISDSGNHMVREVLETTGDIITVAGNGKAGYAGDNGPATAAELNHPVGLAFDSAGDLFIGDSNSNVVREVVKATGEIITVAGNGTAGYSGNNGPATGAELNGASFLAVDSAGDLFIGDAFNNVVREMTPAVTVTVAGQLVIHTQPSATATAGQAFDVQPVVYLEDASGNLETTDNSTVVTVALASGTGPLQAKARSATVAGGIATFAGLADNTAETITLKFTAIGLTSGSSNLIVVRPAAPFRLKIQTQPSATAAAGQPFTAQPVITELDQYGNLETTDSSTVITAALSLGNGPLVGTTTAKLAGGVATFTDLADTAVGTIELGFSGGRLSVGPSNQIAISPGPATKLSIRTPPYSSVVAGNPLTDRIVIDVVDQYGNLETGDNSTQVTVSLASGGGMLAGGPTNVTVKGGVASFEKLEDDTAGVLTLRFTAGNLPPVTSNPTTVSPAPASLLKIVSQPAGGVTAGQAFSLTVNAYDPYGNLATSFKGPVTVGLASGSGANLSGTLTADAANGVATFTDLIATTSGPLSLSASSGSLSSPPTSPISVSAGTATQLVVSTPPPEPLTAGQPFTLVVSAEDAFHNVDPSFNGAVTISLPGEPGFPRTVQAQNGVATFTGLTLDAAAGGGTIQATAGGLSAGTTGPILLTPTITGEQVLTIRKTNKKGKPVGKPVFAGFALEYSAAMNPDTAGQAANYQMVSNTTRRIKKKTVIVHATVALTAAYDPATHTVRLNIQGNPKFTSGGQLTVNNAPGGVTSAVDALLGGDNVFTILPKGAGITAG